MTITLYNSLHHKLEEFKPNKKGRASIYSCGPTVYHYAHIGNLRSYVFSDILKKTLLQNGYKVKHIINLTDVGHLVSDSDEGEDKMEKGSRREGKSAWDIAKFYIQAFRQDIEQLNIAPPDIWARATDHIKEQIKLIKKIEKNGYTYRTNDGIYFDTSRLADYGQMANLTEQNLQAGVRVDMGEKKNSTDFALWKFSPASEKRQMEWPSPWGVGFPGWHVECSAMAEKYLGKTFDIHTGGIDHIPVHHINEMAQSRAANNCLLANYWLHNEFLNLDNGEKMAKSGDNFTTIQTLIEKGIAPLAYRYLLLQTHYRKQLKFSFESLAAAANGLNNLYKETASLLASKISTAPVSREDTRQVSELSGEILGHLNNDLDTPQALAVLWKMFKQPFSPHVKLMVVKEADKVLGLSILASADKYTANTRDVAIPEDINILVQSRQAARLNRDYKESDRLRDELQTKGWQVKDEADGKTTLFKI